MSREEKGALVWLAAAACLVFGFLGFALAIPWTFSVTSVARAAQSCPGAIDPSWAAVECNHGRPYEWEYGLISDHPIRYGLAWLQLVVGWGAFFYLVPRIKKYR
jgi:hypothetical protein